MRLNDIWVNVKNEIGFYTKENFDKVPSVPGVYGWFYPLRVVTKDPIEFIKEVNTILDYDATTRDCPKKTESIEFAWKTLDINIHLKSTTPRIERFLDIWEEAAKDEKKFEVLRRTIMKASIFMPPLYVGKTTSLRTRCFQHLNGNDKENDFHGRYTSFAKKNNIKFSNVADLLFVFVKTIDDVADEKPEGVENLECLVEEIIKNLAKPVYSKK